MLLPGGGLALESRWAPPTLALVHALTLGVLGNAMFGSQRRPVLTGDTELRVTARIFADSIHHPPAHGGACLIAVNAALASDKVNCTAHPRSTS